MGHIICSLIFWTLIVKIPTFTLSSGATSVPASDIQGDYSSSVSIEVTAEDGTTKQVWTVDVSEAVSTGIGNSKSTDLKLQLYPIPAEDFLTIKSEVRISRIVLYDMNGKVVKEINQLDPSTLNVSELETGYYIISFFDEDAWLGSKKLMKR